MLCGVCCDQLSGNYSKKSSPFRKKGALAGRHPPPWIRACLRTIRLDNPGLLYQCYEKYYAKHSWCPVWPADLHCSSKIWRNGVSTFTRLGKLHPTRHGEPGAVAVCQQTQTEVCERRQWMISSHRQIGIPIFRLHCRPHCVSYVQIITVSDVLLMDELHCIHEQQRYGQQVTISCSTTQFLIFILFHQYTVAKTHRHTHRHTHTQAHKYI